MHRIDGAGNVGHMFVAEDAATSRPPTEITPEIMNAFQEELASFIEWAGIVLAKADNTQLKQALLAKFATLDSPTFTGTPKAPTPAAGDNSVKLATTAFIMSIVGNDANFAASMATALGGKASIASIQQAAATTAVAGGTVDAITASFTPAITGVTTGMTLCVIASGANTTTIPFFTPNSAILSPTVVVKGANQPLAAGDIAGAGYPCFLQWSATFAKWVLLNPATGLTTPVASNSGFKNLIGWADGTSASVSYTMDEVTAKDGSGIGYTAKNIALSISTTAAGANGLDTGAIAANSSYTAWAIYNPSTQSWAGVAALSPTLTANTTAGSAVVTGLTSTAFMRAGMVVTGGSLPSGSVIKSVDSGAQITLTRKAASTGAGVSLKFQYDPVLPAGFTAKCRVGSFITDATNKYPLAFTQFNGRFQYGVSPGTNVPSSLQMASGSAGSVSTPTWVAVAISAYVPPAAVKIILGCTVNANGANAADVGIAPNPNYGAVGSTTNPPYVTVEQAWASGHGSWKGDLILESANIYWMSSGATSAILACLGWEENL